jgi:orotate phosphoribosyltransferase
MVKKKILENTIPDNTLKIAHLYICGPYFPLHPNTLVKTAKRIANLLKKAEEKGEIKFDSLACRGVSGIVITPLVSVILGKPFTIVRKEKEQRHSPSLVEGYIQADQRYVILDDFMSSGETVRRIISALSKSYLGATPECAGIVEYRDSTLTLPGSKRWEEMHIDNWKTIEDIRATSRSICCLVNGLPCSSKRK